MKLLSVKKSTRKGKKLMAEFDDGTTSHFGAIGSSTYIDHKDDKKKDAYIARHKVNENWNDPKSAGALSRYILWNKTTQSASISDFKKRFNL
jgi:formamidopyrimidine-DNA glycosylase